MQIIQIPLSDLSDAQFCLQYADGRFNTVISSMCGPDRLVQVRALKAPALAAEISKRGLRVIQTSEGLRLTR